jgi:hypothetical protein
MKQLNNRNPQFAQSNPQAQMMQRYMPLIFAVIYINIAAGVNVYFIISSLCRIGIQEAIFRSGTLNKTTAAAEGVLPSTGGGKAAAPRRRPLMERLADMQKQALEQKEAQQQARRALPPGDGSAKDSSPTGGPAPRQGPSANGAPKNPGKSPTKSGGSGAPKANGQNPAPKASDANGSQTNGAADKQATHPRSKTKRDRKDR